MKLGVFVSDLRISEKMLERLKTEKLGVFLVQNGVYRAVIKKNGEGSAVIEKDEVDYYCLTEDLQTRGWTSSETDEQINIITYDNLVDLIMNDYEKLIWL